MGGAWPARLRLPGSAPGLSAWSILTLCKMVTRGTPERGEVRNPWGRAGKPETRILRQQEAQEVAESRAKAWSQVLHGRASRRGGKQDDRDLDADDAVEVSITEDIKDFHERAAMLLRESGGRMNSLTFTYKWEQRFGESLVTFLSRQRLTVAEMLKQSNAFWVVDMPGDHGGAGQMSVYILNEKNLPVENARETLGDQVQFICKTESSFRAASRFRAVSVLYSCRNVQLEIGHPIDSGMGLSITIDKLRVLINKTLSTQSLINQLLIKRVGLSIVIDNGKIGQGMRSCKCTNHDLYAGGCQ